MKGTVKDAGPVDPFPHILFEELRQGEMLEGFCQLHAALVISRLGSLTEPNLPVKSSAHTRTHTDVLMLIRNHKGQRRTLGVRELGCSPNTQLNTKC